MKTIGSQRRDTLEDSGLKLISRKGNTVVLEHCGHKEIWVKNNHYAGYVIEIDGVGYEFVTSFYE